MAAIEAPTQILIGSDDELFIAKAYPSQIRSANPHIPVHVLPGITHMGIISDEDALDHVAEATQRMLQAETGN